MNLNISRIYILVFFSIAFGFTAMGQVKIGNNHEDLSPYAVLELESADKGFLISRMTTAQRDSSFDQNTPVGMIIYNTDTQGLEVFRETIDANGNLTGIKEWITLDLSTSDLKNQIDAISNNSSSTTNNSGLAGIVGTTAPDPAASGTIISQQELGTLYINAVTGDTYVAIDTSNDSVPDQWFLLEGTQGPAGANGTQGPAGVGVREITLGTSVPSTSTITDPGMYFDSAAAVLYLYDPNTAMWNPTGGSSTDDQRLTTTFTDADLTSTTLRLTVESDGSGTKSIDLSNLNEVLASTATPTTANLANVKPGDVFIRTTDGSVSVAVDTNSDGTADSWEAVGGVTDGTQQGELLYWDAISSTWSPTHVLSTEWIAANDTVSTAGSGVYDANNVVLYLGSFYRNLTGENDALTTPNADTTNWEEIGANVASEAATVYYGGWNDQTASAVSSSTLVEAPFTNTATSTLGNSGGISLGISAATNTVGDYIVIAAPSSWRVPVFSYIESGGSTNQYSLLGAFYPTKKMIVNNIEYQLWVSDVPMPSTEVGTIIIN